MSAVATATRPAPSAEQSTLQLYRDDGPLARVLAPLGARVPLPPVLLIALGAAPALVLMIAEGAAASKGAVAAALAWLVLLGALSAGRPHTDRFRWAGPPGVRLCEYAGIVWLGALAGTSSRPAALALLGALAFRHYDLVYRLRHQGLTPPAWVSNLAGGWEGRLIVGYVLWAADLLPTAFFILAGVLAAVFVAESVASWRRWGRAQQPVLYDDEEDAAE